MIARWSALVLAGGAGRRFGGRKLLADLAGAPVIRRVADRIVGVGFAEVIAVTGAEDEAIKRALAGADVSIILATDWAEGMAATLRTGIAALDPHSEGVCIFLGDMPLVPAALSPTLVTAAAQAGYAARPRCEGKPGHPVAFTRAAFGDLLALEGDRGATVLLAARGEGVAYVETADSGVLLDIDTPEDLAAAVAAWKA
ncbi:nucleotidyltransferase family protein [Porphyrobacter sp. YT40]|uniref:nucleotidyltransferase family protein n=1 Tax=Porphyrobacter sp. YT40 TaxID=2547601 RepID=UPI0011431132|nr:nucleotidyltransferase family protein [Porphyrobacter sp. YT40]QDH35331.1 nucleotidyltransferase family protein [Porphyrobacter sp. YT40]